MAHPYLFRVNGNSRLGIGHLTECIELAKKLRKSIFLVNDNPAVKKLLEQDDIDYRTLLDSASERDEIKEINNLIAIEDPAVVIFDIPWIRQDYIDRLNLDNSKLAMINALFNPIKADIHIATVFTPLNENKQYYGLGYAFIKEEFIGVKAKPAAKMVRSVLVMFGGSDNKGFTIKTLKALKDVKNEFKVQIILGASFSYEEELKDALKNYPHSYSIKRNARKILPYMQKADLAIISGGYTASELSVAGVPMIVMCQTELEHDRIFPQFSNAGAIINMGYGTETTNSELQSRIKILIEDYELRKRLVRNASDLVDVNGTMKAANLIKDL